MTRELFSFAEVAERWGVSAFTVRRAVERGDLKSTNVLTRRLIHRAEIERAEQVGVGKTRKQAAR